MRTSLLILLLSSVVLSERTTRFTNLKCEVIDESYVSFSKCNLKVVGRGIIALNVHANLLKGPFYNSKVNLSLWRKYNVFHPFLYNATLDYCKAAACTNSTMTFQRIIYRALKKYSNLNHTCPFEKEIVISNWVLQDEQLKFLPQPSGEYQLKLKGFTDNKCRAILYANFLVKESLLLS